jgi:hypothetical protein
MRNGFFLSIFIVLALGSSSLKAEQGGLMSILQKQPVFELKLKGFGAMYIIEINAMSVFEQDNPERQVTTRLPINHYMRSGDNAISIATWSGDDNPINPHANIKIELIVSQHNKPQKEFIVSTLYFDNSVSAQALKTEKSSASGGYNAKQAFIADEHGEVQVADISFKQNKNVSTFSRKITIPSSLPLWAFFNSDDLPDYYGLSDDEYDQHMDVLLIEYMKVQNAIAGNKIETILPMFAERNRELDLAFYNEPDTLSAKIKTTLIEAANDQTATLVELKADYLDMEVSENHKLNRLYRKGGQQSS